MIRKIKSKIRSAVCRVCASNKRLSSFYYFLFDNSFSREHYAVLNGKLHHINEAKVLKANYFLLVRNTHRIEKGLLMRPKRKVFAKNYIEETVDSFVGVYQTRNNSNPQIKWFVDVLTEYFELSGLEDDFLIKQHAKFMQALGQQTIDQPPVPSKSIPYHRLEEDRSNIQFDEFYKLTKQRRSVRWFKDTPVPRELIDKAVLAANQSPSACNRQPFEFRIIDDKELVKDVVKFPMGTSGYGHNIPIMIVLVGNLDAYFDERDRHVIYIDASLASMTFMLALETLGLSSCAINWPDIEDRERKMEKFLKLNSHQRPVMCMGIGYPDENGMVAFSEKRELDYIRKFNQ